MQHASGFLKILDSCLTIGELDSFREERAQSVRERLSRLQADWVQGRCAGMQYCQVPNLMWVPPDPRQRQSV
jgi:hypothetical protein